MRTCTPQLRIKQKRVLPWQNMAEKMHQQVQDVCKDDFGETFFYSDVYFGKDENDDIVKVEVLKNT